MWVIDETIPGWTSKEKLEVLAEYASKVKENGWIVELGSLLGRSAYVLASNCHPTVKVTCIDIWQAQDLSNKNILGTKSPFIKNSRNNFLHFTEKCRNITAMQCRWPLDSHFQPVKKADLVFIDADHSYKATYEALDYWFTKTEDCNIIVDDYNTDAHKAVTEAVNDFCKNNKLKVLPLTSCKGLVRIINE